MERYRAHSLRDPTLEREFGITDTSFTGTARRRHLASRFMVDPQLGLPPAASSQTARAAAATSPSAAASMRRRGGMHTWRMQNDEWAPWTTLVSFRSQEEKTRA